MHLATLAGALAASALLLVPLATAAAAQDRDCPDFASQAEAQQALDPSAGDPERLDSDGDGIACESLGEPAPPTTTSARPDPDDDSDDDPSSESTVPSSSAATETETDDGSAEASDPPSTGIVALASTPARDRDCPDFVSQAEAQQALDSSAGDPERLDRDDDGIACESHFGEPAGSATQGSVEVTSDSDTDDTNTTDTTDDGGTLVPAGGQVRVVPHGGVDTGDGSSVRAPAT